VRTVSKGTCSPSARESVPAVSQDLLCIVLIYFAEDAISGTALAHMRSTLDVTAEPTLCTTGATDDALWGNATP